MWAKIKCCPKVNARKITREEHEDARQVARDMAKTKQYAISMRLRKKVEMLFAHLKRILGLGRLRLRGPWGVQDEFTLAATAQNLRKLAKLTPMAHAAGYQAGIASDCPTKCAPYPSPTHKTKPLFQRNRLETSL